MNCVFQSRLLQRGCLSGTVFWQIARQWRVSKPLTSCTHI